jgi:hypothetical protein
MTEFMDYLSAGSQAAVIGYTLYNVGSAVYRRWFGKRSALINRAQNMVVKVFDELNHGVDLEVDDVTVVVPSTVMDSADIKAAVKRRVKTKAPFRSWLIKVGKAKFGLVSRTEANRMCIRKYLYDQCIDHGVLARHIWENVDFATEMVFVPTEVEMLTAALSHTNIVRGNNKMLASLGKSSPKVA